MKKSKIESILTYSIAVVFTAAMVCSCGNATDSSQNRKEQSDKKAKVLEVSYNEGYESIEGDNILFTVDEESGTATLTSFNDVESEKITLPDKILYEKKEYTVTTIGEGAFESNQSLVEITLGDQITGIEGSAFYACAALEKVTLDSKLEEIGTEAFAEAQSLNAIKWNEQISFLGDYAFRGCIALTELTLPKSISRFGEGVFMDCTGLQTCTLEKGITNVGKGMFTNCDSLTEINIPNTVKEIGEEAFWGCLSLTKLDIPEKLLSVGARAFYSTSIQSLKFPKHLTGFSLETVEGMAALEKVLIPKEEESTYQELLKNFGVELVSYE